MANQTCRAPPPCAIYTINIPLLLLLLVFFSLANDNNMILVEAARVPAATPAGGSDEHHSRIDAMRKILVRGSGSRLAPHASPPPPRCWPDC